jgi:hypothetical protein
MDPVLLVFHSTCTIGLVQMLPIEEIPKIPEAENLTVIYRGSNFLSIPVECFSIAVFFRGERFKMLSFWGVGGVRFLLLSEFYVETLICLPSKTNTLPKTPCQVWDGIWNPERLSVYNRPFKFRKTLQNTLLLAESIKATLHKVRTIGIATVPRRRARVISGADLFSGASDRFEN